MTTTRPSKHLFSAIEDSCLIPFDGSFLIKDCPTSPPDTAPGKKENKKLLQGYVDELDRLQRMLYAHDRFSVLLIFQALDAAGKDSTIRAVLSGVNPAGCQVFNFKQPSSEELDHDFLWRSSRRLPERGRIGVFNRSYYEELLVAKVHPEIIESQKLPYDLGEGLWARRYDSVREHEKHLARSGTVILKFFLNVSKEEQRRRFIARLEDPRKNWKFSKGDLVERGFWDSYMSAYQDALNETSRPWAPWYSIPADNKRYMRARVAQIITSALKSLDMSYPELSKHETNNLKAMKKTLMDEES